MHFNQESNGDVSASWETFCELRSFELVRARQITFKQHMKRVRQDVARWLTEEKKNES